MCRGRRPSEPSVGWQPMSPLPFSAEESTAFQKLTGAFAEAIPNAPLSTTAASAVLRRRILVRVKDKMPTKTTKFGEQHTHTRTL